MTTTIRIQASLASKSMLPEDAAVNVWHFTSLGTDRASNTNAMDAALDTFYTSLADIFCANTLTGDWTFKAYDLADPEPRTPFATYAHTGATLTTGDGLPTECAVCLSIEGVAGSGFNMRRRRGRLYIGPLSNGVSTTVTGYVYVSPTAMGIIMDAAEELRSAGGLDFVWSVYSPTAAGPTPDAAAILAATTYVDHGWIDNAFDTQRRRGTVASTRAVFP